MSVSSGVVSGRAWLLVFTGAIDAYDLQRLAAYVALLDVALAFASAEATAHSVSTITRRLADVEDTPETRASLALEELRNALGGVVGDADDRIVEWRAPAARVDARDRRAAKACQNVASDRGQSIRSALHYDRFDRPHRGFPVHSAGSWRRERRGGGARMRGRRPSEYQHRGATGGRARQGSTK